MILWVEGKSLSEKATPSPQLLFRNRFPSTSTRFLGAAIIMKTERLLLITVISVKILLVLAVFFLFGEDRFVWADTMHYSGLGKNIFLGNGFSFPNDDGVSFVPTTAFMPLYPALLGFFSLYIPHGLVALSLLQAVAAGFTALFIFRIGKFFLPDSWALGAALVASFEPLVAAIHLLLMPETFFIFFVTVFLYYFLLCLQQEEKADTYKAVAALVLALYTKPAAAYLVIIAAVFLLFSRNGFRRAAVFISIMVLAVLPWTMRNNAVAGTYVLNTNGARNICSWGLSSLIAVKYRVDSSNWDTTVHLPEYVAVKERCTSVGRALWIFSTEYPVQFPVMLALSGMSVLTNEGYTVFFENPDEQLKIHNNYLTPAVFSNRDWPQKITAAFHEFSAPELFAIFAGKLFWLAVSILAAIGIYRSLRERKTRILTIFLLVVIIYFVGASMLAAGLSAGARYRYQVDAILIIFASVGLYMFTGGSSVVLRHLPITKTKIAIARLLYRLVRMVYGNDKQIVTRGGIVYELDLSEGIDLSVFLFGSFQKHVFQNRYFTFKGDEVVFDVGANVGVMSLQFAKCVPHGAVYAFEPTHYALTKLKKNILLNPTLASRITVVQAFLSAAEASTPSIPAYASWKVDGSRGATDHPVHLGTPKETMGVGSTTIDVYIKQNNITRLDFIKIDTDGHEWDVLRGASRSIETFRPIIIFEVGEYVMKERGITFETYYEFFHTRGYDLFDSNRAGAIDKKNYQRYIPAWGAIDIIAVTKRQD